MLDECSGAFRGDFFIVVSVWRERDIGDGRNIVTDGGLPREEASAILLVMVDEKLLDASSGLGLVYSRDDVQPSLYDLR